MTREEAIKIMSRIWGGSPQYSLAESYTDAFVALGMLKLDEPKDARHRGVDAINNAGGAGNWIVRVLDSRGLKIVEK